jgi:glycosyltransferase involved in cell wall biosynthesis
MKICYVATDIEVPYRSVGGSGGSTHTFEVARNLVSLGNEVDLICMKGFKNQKEKEVIDGINIYRIYTGADKALSLKKTSVGGAILKVISPMITRFMAYFYGLKVTNIILSNNCDLIYERSSSLGAGGIASLITGKPLVLEVNDPLFSFLSLKLAKKVITTKIEILQGKIEEWKIKEVMWGANTDVFSPEIDSTEIKQKYGLNKKIIILYIGSFAPWHGVEEIIEASKIVVQKNANIKFLMVGTGPEEIEYRKRISQLNLDDYFIFTGPIKYEEVPKFICAADLALAPFNPNKHKLTRKYGFYFTPLKIFEYMACGKPTISTRIDNITKVIEDGKTGLLVNPGDHKALGEAILKLLSDEDTRIRMGIAARRIVETRYSWKKHTTELMEILKEAMRG